jgi:hypothetical protein
MEDIEDMFKNDNSNEAVEQIGKRIIKKKVMKQNKVEAPPTLQEQEEGTVVKANKSNHQAINEELVGEVPGR